MSEKAKVTCKTCKDTFEQNTGRGRPRQHCKKCRPVRTAKKS